jgi:murein DD-endopeptidase MepM/ murein hydrolase activator NlpD
MALLPVGVPAVVIANAPSQWDRSEQHLQVASLPPLPNPGAASDRVWVRMRRSTTLQTLADSLNLAPTKLADLNDVESDHQFNADEWLVLPSGKVRLAKLLPQIDSRDLRRTPPLHQLPPVETNGVVKLGDTLRQIAKRYGVTLQELLRHNPGLETARLVVGTPIRVVQSAPARPRQRLLLGLKPGTSGGLSWPELPDFGDDGSEADQNFSAQGWIWPSKGMFTSGFGWRWGRMHKGIDIANNVGTPIVAAKAGVVTFSGWHGGGYGYLVTLSHADGSRSLYAHNSRLLVRQGQQVPQGEPIAQMGSTGRSTGPHLHFEIHPPGRGAVNPLQFLPQRA